VLKIREPSLESNHVVDLSLYFKEYEALVHKTEEDIETVKDAYPEASGCGAETNDCCYRYVVSGRFVQEYFYYLVDIQKK
jgi:hypothetical protein